MRTNYAIVAATAAACYASISKLDFQPASGASFIDAKLGKYPSKCRCGSSSWKSRQKRARKAKFEKRRKRR